MQLALGPHVLAQMLLPMSLGLAALRHGRTAQNGVHSDPEDFLLVCVLQLSRHRVLAGASMQAIGKAAAEEAAWAKLQRSAAWWLGEYGNVAAEESSGSIQAVRSAASIEAALQQKASPAELMALQVHLCIYKLQA